MTDLTFSTASELAEAIRNRQVTATEVLEAHLAQIARHNPTLNAIVTLDEGGARQRAQEADAALERNEVWGALHGVPVTIKDSFATAGLRTTSGHPPLADYIPKYDATVVARLKQAGAILLGKTNLPPLAADSLTDNAIFGRTNNPWNLERTPGGSSGGEGAALAAGLSPLGIGSDIGGSVRIPAHYCGLFSIKPTERRVPNSGHIPPLPGEPNYVHFMPTSGPMARSLADLRLALRIIAGADNRDMSVVPVTLVDIPAKPLNELRLAWSDDFGIPLGGEVRSALEKLAADLQAAGCKVERKNPPGFDFDMARRTYGEVFGSMFFAGLPGAMRMLYPALGPVMFKDTMFRAAARAARFTAPQLLHALDQRNRLSRALEAFLGGYDAWLCPVTATPAFPHRVPNRIDWPIDVDGKLVTGAQAGIGFTIMFSLTGHPAVVIPLAHAADGLPIGVQAVGPLWSEMHLLNVAERLQEITGPFRRPPGY